MSWAGASDVSAMSIKRSHKQRLLDSAPPKAGFITHEVSPPYLAQYSFDVIVPQNGQIAGSV